MTKRTHGKWCITGIKEQVSIVNLQREIYDLEGANARIGEQRWPVKRIVGKIRNAHVMRWNLAMQNYSFHIKYIRGIDNVMADYLSRAIGYIRVKSNLIYKYSL